MKKFVIFVLSVFLLMPLIAPVSVQAENCDCYCTQVELGMKTYSTMVTAEESVADCMRTCDLLDNKVFYACADPHAPSPETNNLCWTNNECTQTPATDADGKVMRDSESAVLFNEWGGADPQCTQGYGLCFRPPEKIKLGMPIAELTEVGDLGTYIDAFYSWIIPAAVIMAIVLVMIGGFQWAMARGSADRVKKAKDRIVKAVFGLLLLFGAYAIAYLIDPRLTSFKSLRIPIVKTVVFLAEGSSCEDIEAALGPGSVTPASGSSSAAAAGLGTGGKSCGDIGIVGPPTVNSSVTAVGVDPGDECVYERCSGYMDSCINTGVDEYECVSCADVYQDGEYGGLIPSEVQCSKFTPTFASGTSIYNNTFYECSYLYGSDLSGDRCVNLQYPKGSDGINCDVLRTDARAGDSESCRAYDLVWGASSEGGGDYLDELAGMWWTYDALVAVAEADPCGFGRDTGGCEVIAWTGADSVIAGLAASVLCPICAVGIVSYNITVETGNAVNANMQGGTFSHVDCVNKGAEEDGYITGVKKDGTVGKVDWNITW